ncbi:MULTISPECIES: CotS family spore coat protein [unclassified Clostridium]|uniref:CotS family spore coat protein n=1 Tax=unclassified Clostridium TaxID=2614128 RepID=UPI0013CB84A7|nr:MULTISPECIES: CotS family spore coat protein [unclassified Clostridium]MBZ9690261.1 CotS family spore coat protein [Clostridium sp. M14]NFI95109.1 CotS family spore coat protein [Clostridium botulinum]NFO89960.1 CotS family spore coat protein [Clostridium botulinum]
MNRIRYADRKSLCDYDLSFEFFNELGININDISPVRNVFIIYTDNGNKILKKVDCNEKKLTLINESLNYIKDKYNNIITYSEFENGSIYKTWKDKTYVVMDLLDGREACFTNPLEIKLCAENIALMHKASSGIREELIKKLNEDFLDESLEIKFRKAYDELSFFKELVSKYKYKNEFDNLFINNVDKYLQDIIAVEELLSKSKYIDLRKNGQTISLCHNDLAYHNFLIKKENVSIIDFDFLTIDLRIMDIADFILKSIKNSAFDIDKMLLAINSYEDVLPLMQEEKEILYILLYFPRDFYNISRDYYYKRKKWDYEVYLNRFNSKLNNEQFRKDFIEEYKCYILSEC